MSKRKRIDLLFDLSGSDTNANGKVRKRKEPSIPPKNDKELNAIIDDIYERNPILSYCLMMQALTGLRYSDCSQLMFRDFYRNGRIVDSFSVIQQKTFGSRVTKRVGKFEREFGYPISKDDHSKIVRKAARDSTVTVYMNDSIEDLVVLCKREQPESEYLFANKNPKSNGLPMDIRNAEYHLRKTEINLALNYQLRTHSFRKCFSLKLIRDKVSILVIRDLLGHANIATTNAYLSTIDGEMADVIKGLKYW
ncbi:tyrosine-type recombinase/integrase [Photobacterium damselae]|uniref:tyrosine-type recombinase/integrase n=1 Tax=Photobacterium damselae TaxID=38293 RepID=UPI0040690EF4